MDRYLCRIVSKANFISSFHPILIDWIWCQASFSVVSFCDSRCNLSKTRSCVIVLFNSVVNYWATTNICWCRPFECCLIAFDLISIFYESIRYWRDSSCDNLNDWRGLAEADHVSGFDFKLISRAWDNASSVVIWCIRNVLSYLNVVVIVAFILTLFHFHSVIDHFHTSTFRRSGPWEWDLGCVGVFIILNQVLGRRWRSSCNDL